ncbi:choice-of-anchor Q domain-containing protein [Cocleimonas flava]|uniref:Outer membrane repeat protein n=1 Tax=Cocleimonas flava TaxID=634765 RepID=A0A4R1ESH4_9GAMM|nr:choice-of-anchor Q domain-containing protein [Cocleimonas flava]TCJ82714.1 hypothetical protein EV695_3446 [Cocleimonas flava]
MKKQNLIWIGLLLSTLACQSGWAATIKVCQSGCAYTSIADGVAAASAGDSIEISNGIYFERDIIIDKELKIVGESQQNVIMNATEQGRHFFIAESSVNVFIGNMRLMNGNAKANSLPSSVDYFCSHNSIYSGYSQGGSICSKSVNLELRHVSFENNKASNAGGALSYQGRDSNGVSSGKLIISKSQFLNNSVYWAHGNMGINQKNYGGAIHVLYSELVSVSNSVFSKNSVYHKASNGSVAAASGGAIFVSSTKNLFSTQNHYEKNESSGNSGAVYFNSGWGWRNVQADAKFTEDTFRSNYSEVGGAISSFSDIIVKRSTFHENKANSGGAIHNQGILLAQNNTFSGNYALTEGAAIVHAPYYPWSQLTIQNNTFVGNASDDQTQGGVIAISDRTGFTPEIVNSLFFKNDTHECYLNGTPPLIQGMNNLTDSSSCEPTGYTNLAADYNGYPFSLGTATDVDPNLANNGGLTLTHAISRSSTALDSGTMDCITPANNGAPIINDQRGAPRVKYCDIGSFEYQ